MPTLALIGGLVLLVVLGGWVAITEAKSGAVKGEALKTARRTIDATKRFNKARRDSRGLPRRDRIERMLREVREGGG
jgi:hypothetical protein